MPQDLAETFRAHRQVAYALLRRSFALGRIFLNAADLRREFDVLVREHGPESLRQSAFAWLVNHVQEAAIRQPWSYLSLRVSRAEWRFFRIHFETMQAEEVSVAEYLAFKEMLVEPQAAEQPVLEIDFGPFSREFPRMKETRSIGQGVLFLNRALASAMFSRGREAEEKLLNFLRVHAIEGQPLLLNGELRSARLLRERLRQALVELATLDPGVEWARFADSLKALGFAPGWGSTAARAAETMELLVDILEAPSPDSLERFLARIPMISRLLIVTPHGFFGQDNVLGLPDTGGQVVYILDQVRALEREMRERLAVQGVPVEPKIVIVTRRIPEARGTTCNQRLERVIGCENTWILRVPFHDRNGTVVPGWVSRFEIWPYLERFATDAEHEALAELGGRPDLVIGNYSDGSLVATLIAQRLGITQCNIAHALEKTKYPLADVQWKERETQYHFSCQFTADLIAMNAADFIITSTYHEIAGTEDAEGQYASYRYFTLPGLYRVVNGMDPLDPKFNIVSPGANEEVFFPYHDRERRIASVLPEIEQLVYGRARAAHARGTIDDGAKPLVFTMARLDRIKNLAGLVEWYGASQRLRGAANLLVVGGVVDPGQSQDQDERQEIRRLHRLFDQYRLDGQARWLGLRLDKNLAGELYRFVADTRGVFVQPALYEAFGLTIIEAMATGLPVFATTNGGPREIIEHGRSGFHIDPEDGPAAAEAIASFLEAATTDAEAWRRISEAALARVAARYTWRRYAERMMSLSRIYGFWKFVSGLQREETARYLNMFYHLQFRPLAAGVTRR
jgi:sucrose synthase